MTNKADTTKPFEKDFANLRAEWNDVIDILCKDDTEAVRSTLDRTFKLIYSMQNKLAHITDDSSYDSLTGAYNRAYCTYLLNTLKPSADKPITIVAGDVNNLKLTNDIFGHNAGDELLKNIVNIMKSCGKDSYIIGRFGGDEFNAILPGADYNEAVEYCNRIKQTCLEYDGEYLPPSISLGVKSSSECDFDLNKTLEKAEELMYHDKTVYKSKQNIFTDVIEILYKRKLLIRENQELVVVYIEGFCKYLGLDAQTISNLCLAARINDIGFIALPGEIIRKNKRTQEELDILKVHSEIGYRIAKLYDESFPVANIILQHHESYDGTGYPQGLKGDEILLTAQILSLTSTFAYWCAPKPLGSGLSIEEAYERIEIRTRTQFSAKLLKQFKNYIEQEVLHIPLT